MTDMCTTLGRSGGKDASKDMRKETQGNPTKRQATAMRTDEGKEKTRLN